MLHRLKLLTLAAALAACAAPAWTEAAPTFDAKFASGMVLQQGAPIILTGTANPGAGVNLSLGGTAATTTADVAGHWKVTLPAMGPGTDYTLRAENAGGRSEHHDISIGDVFLCSGQSNMAWTVAAALNPAREIEGPLPNNIRLLKIPERSESVRQAALPDGARWTAATPETVSGFSAICYFFGRDWQASQNVPVGLIDASWGGSRIEAWISPEMLSQAPHLADRLDLLALYNADQVAATAQFGTMWESWWRAAAGTVPWQTGLDAPRSVPRPMRDWKEFGDPDIETHLGMLWYERTVTLTPAQAAGAATLSLGGIDEIDTVWINGQFLGTTFGWGTERHYPVPAGMLEAGENRITVNVHNGWGQGGMIGPDSAMQIAAANGETILLGDGWVYQKVAPELGHAPQTPWMSVSGLAGMHNAMIAPLAGLNFAGALWYQGESNAGEPETYQLLLRLLTEDLRTQFGADLPLLVIQLPEFGPRMYAAGNSGWSSLRDAQRRFVMSDDRTGLVVTLGAGDEWDIHPPNKQEVARRARSVWNAVTTDPSAPARTGHSPDSARSEPPFVRIPLPDGAAPYQTSGHHRPIGFMLCGAGGNGCAFAEAWLRGNVIEIDNPFTDAALVRYCWGDTPVCNLMTPEGNPVTPFELEIE